MSKERQPLLIIQNHHVASCGTPPTFSNEPGVYIGYFANVHGEQWVFMYVRSTGVTRLYGGDVGWEKSYTVREGKAVGLILNAEESAWLQACWNAARKLLGKLQTHFELDEPSI